MLIGLNLNDVNEGCPSDGAAILRTVYRLPVGEGYETMLAASSSIGNPRAFAIDSNSSSFSTAN